MTEERLYNFLDRCDALGKRELARKACEISNMRINPTYRLEVGLWDTKEHRIVVFGINCPKVFSVNRHEEGKWLRQQMHGRLFRNRFLVQYGEAPLRMDEVRDQLKYYRKSDLYQ